MARCVATHDGLLTLGGAQVTGYVQTRSELDLPHAQLLSSTATMDLAACAKSRKMTMEPSWTDHRRLSDAAAIARLRQHPVS